MSVVYEKRFAVHPGCLQNIRYNPNPEGISDRKPDGSRPDQFNVFVLRSLHRGRRRVPVSKIKLELTPIDPLKADYFLQRREMGIINVGGAGRVVTENEPTTPARSLYLEPWNSKDCIRIG